MKKLPPLLQLHFSWFLDFLSTPGKQHSSCEYVEILQGPARHWVIPVIDWISVVTSECAERSLARVVLTLEWQSWRGRMLTDHSVLCQLLVLWYQTISCDLTDACRDVTSTYYSTLKSWTFYRGGSTVLSVNELFLYISSKFKDFFF